MLHGVYVVEDWVNLILFVVVLALEAVALVDAVSHPAKAFEATGKLSKGAWLLILGLSVATSLAFRAPTQILGLVGATAAGVYLADVRPAVRGAYRRR